MANERLTESIVRKHFETYVSDMVIEEQASSNPRIHKLLARASKQGDGGGYPDFIITCNSNPHFVIVVECKASVEKHKSNTGKEFAEYAVDGVLLYASYLSKDFDILAIAVSGSPKSSLRVSHFLQLKGNTGYSEIFGSKLLPVNDYLDGYIKSPEKYRQDYDALLKFADKLNRELHTHKIPEKDRSLLISAALIALEQEPFKKSYETHNTAKQLAKALIETVANGLQNAQIPPNRLDDLKEGFNFIGTDTSLSEKPNILRNLIRDIDENVNSFIKTHKYHDVLGQMYIEFLRYANSDNGLGIVLTPPHITELFTELAQVNKDSVVYDNCAGTGGFLISAMKAMIQDTNNDSRKENKIKSSQLHGVEYQAHIYPLAVSNMHIHNDGKTNIIKGDCLTKEIIQEIKSKKPNIGLLNPPYQADKKNDVEELEFVLNNLECLAHKGTCVAIVPMRCALAVTGRKFELKQQLLEKHTLEAVLSMPDELFFNAKVSVVTCTMIFTAHQPHPPHKESFFGYCKNDGFEKQKPIGRSDIEGRWDSIKTYWVSSFINRKQIEGFSVNKIVTAQDEWCAEAYMETDYTNLPEDAFIQTVKDFVAFQFLHGREGK